MPAPTVVATASGVGLTDVTITVPVEAQAGDLLLVVASTHGTAPLMQPAGWATAEAGLTFGDAPVVQGYACLAWRRVNGADPTTYTWTGGTSSTTAAMLVVRGAIATGSPFDSTSSQINSTVPPIDSCCPAIVTSVADTLIVAGVGVIDNRGLSAWAVTDPGALTEQVEILTVEGLDSASGIATAAKATTGSTGNLTVSLVFSSYVAFLAAVLPVGSVSTQVTKTAATTWDVDTAPTTVVTGSVVTTWDIAGPAVDVPGAASTVRTRYTQEWRVLSGDVATVVPPTPPRDLAAIPATGELALTWDAPADSGGAPIVGYHLSILPDDAAPVTLPPSARNHTIEGLINGTNYTITLTAANASLASDPAEVLAVPAGEWVIGSIGPIVGAPDGWGGNGGANNGRGYYGATEPPPGVTNGAQMGPEYCGVRPVLDAQGRDYTYLRVIDYSHVGQPFIDAKGLVSGTIGLDTITGTLGLEITRPGALVEYIDMVGQVKISAPNVTMRYCRISGREIVGSGKYVIATSDTYPGFNMSYCEIECGLSVSAAIPPYGSYTARYCEVYHCGNDAFKTGKDTLIEFCWTHSLQKAPGGHCDSHQITSGDNAAVRFNRFDMYTGGQDTPSPLLADVANAITIVGHMTGDCSWFAFDDNYGDGCNLIVRAGVESPQTVSRGTFVTYNLFYRRNRFGLRFISGPWANEITPGFNQIFDDSNVWHISGQTYHRQGKAPGRWFYSHYVTEGTPVRNWTASHFEEFIP
ncbi:fibronectin type III domain protein [Micromonospora pisi]|uniref:Fibronectin type III domain protein n=1 Tax=Micromonospora pisi TaxID=589240 RepID=A0A495JX67_9ACTN|nr:fibronectin type III domain-containing protein [Micromonospora pisi]RKR92779.1 fibronectin type III domain protein [Micromonospora pisi]